MTELLVREPARLRRVNDLVGSISCKEGRLASILRRLLDIMVALMVLTLSVPILIVIWLAVRLTSPGPAIFQQQRVGRNGRLFTFYKFRGMYVDARERWPELYEYRLNPHQLQHFRFHPEKDPRVTPIGRFIRQTSLDELLNFWNVLKGDMSVVGPRPEIPEMIPYYGRDAAVVLSVKPGVTSLAKATGRDNYTFLETLQLDVRYAQRRSLWLDLRIMFATVVTVLFQSGVLPG